MAADPITALLEVGNSLLSRVWPDPAQQAEAQYKLQKLAQDGDLAGLQAEVNLMLGQLKINEQEAQHPSIFVAGWRPFVGWVGGISFAYATILEPMLRFVATVIFDYAGTYPEINTDLTIQILFGILGLGVMRTYEKKAGAETVTTRTTIKAK